jgi:hypothetical protein
MGAHRKRKPGVNAGRGGLAVKKFFQRVPGFAETANNLLFWAVLVALGTFTAAMLGCEP